MTTLCREASVSVVRACDLVGLARSSHYRIAGGYSSYKPVRDPIPQAERTQPTTLTTAEQQSIHDALTDPRWDEESVSQVYWNAFDLGLLTMSLRTFYRYAGDLGFVGDRRRRSQRRRKEVHGKAPVATRPGQVWSWDITDLYGPQRQRFKLYLAIDVYSRYPVAWRIEHREDRYLAVEMFAQAFADHGVPGKIHSDNGPAMRSEALIESLEKAGVLRSYSRPRVSDDNPFSESLFRTVKYDLSCPDRFADIDHAREWTGQFLHRYLHRRHSRMGWQTPADLFTGTAAEVSACRQARLDQLYKLIPAASAATRTHRPSHTRSATRRQPRHSTPCPRQVDRHRASVAPVYERLVYRGQASASRP
ncbi:MAG: DDE-type integrase/transposase/recombinase [Gordonia sp. (in: high G+C Gram-positive bacteria)]